MVPKPTIALCIPAYNAAKYLPRILTSAKEQLIPFDEILVYDDCSTDNTNEVAKQYGAMVINAHTNSGCSYGRLKLAEAATSSWIHFHDADDDLMPTFTTLAHKWLSKTNIPDIILFSYEWRDFATNELLSVTCFNQQALEIDPIKYSIQVQINPFCGLYNKKKFLEAGGPDLDPLVLHNEDVAMHCKLAQYGLKFSAEKEVSIVNFRINNSMSRSPVSYGKGVNSQFHVMRKNYENTGLKYKKEIAAKLWQYTRYAAWVSDWILLRKILILLNRMEERVPIGESKLFQILVSANSFAAVWVREMFSRITRDKDTFWY